MRDKDESGRYELRHDALAAKIYEKITLVEKELMEIRQFIENAFENYQRRKVFLSASDLSYIAPYENKMFLSGQLEQFVEQSKKEIYKVRKRKRNIAIAAVALLFVIFTGFTIWALNEKNNAEQASAKQLESIVNLNTNYFKTIKNQYQRKTDLYKQFELAYMTSPFKLQGFWNKALNIQKASRELIDFIYQLEYNMISERKNVNIFAKGNKLEIVSMIHFYFVSKTIVGSTINKLTISDVNLLKQKIQNYNKTIYNQIDKKDWDNINFKINTERTIKNSDGDFVTWENAYSQETVGTFTNLNNLITEINYSELDIINYIYSDINSSEFKFNTVEVKVIPKSKYIISGNVYEAEVMLSAYNSKKNMEAYVFDGKKSLSEIDLENTKKMSPFISKNGTVNIKIQTDKVGVQEYAGFISIKQPDGNINRYYFNNEYTVALPMAVISPVRMNVLYIGVNNNIEISVAGFRYEQVNASINNGSLIKSGKGGWIARVTKVGKCNISVTVKDDKGTSRSMGTKEFRVKRVPNPVPTCGWKKGGTISKSKLQSQNGITATLENFDFEYKFKVSSFTLMTKESNGNFIEVNTKGSAFSEKQKMLISKLEIGQYLFVKDINVIDSDGRIFQIGVMMFKIAE